MAMGLPSVCAVELVASPARGSTGITTGAITIAIFLAMLVLVFAILAGTIHA